MGRHNKIGLDYFPFDVDINQDDKIQLIESEFGLKGFAVVVKLFCKIYKDKGYYYNWGEKEKLLFAKQSGESGRLVDEIVSRSVKWGLFDKTVFDQSAILTSKAIQERYFEAASRRDKVFVESNFCLIDVNDYKNVFYVNINNKDVDIGTQSKVKESKVKRERRAREKIPIEKNEDIVENHEDLRAFEFLKKHYPQRFEQDFQMKFSKKIKDKNKFVADFNDVVDTEDLEFTQRKLFGRLGRFARNWCQNQEKFSTKNQNDSDQTRKIPIN